MSLTLLQNCSKLNSDSIHQRPPPLLDHGTKSEVLVCVNRGDCQVYQCIVESDLGSEDTRDLHIQTIFNKTAAQASMFSTLNTRVYFSQAIL